MRISRRTAMGAALAACVSRPAWSQANTPIELASIISGFAAGGGADMIARRLAQRLTDYAKTTVVDLKTGAGGQLAIQYMKNVVPDGRTMLLMAMSPLGIYPHTYKTLAYDPFADLTPVSNVATYDFTVAVGPAVPESVTTVPQLMQWFQQNPSSAAFGYAAIGANTHFVGVMLEREAKVPFAHVGYRGGQPAVIDMMGGQIPGGIFTTGELIEPVKNGKCRVLATTGSAPSRFFPGTSTLASQGYPDLVVNDWIGIFLPKNVPASVVDKLNAAIRTAVADPGMIESLATIGFEAAASSPQELGVMLKTDFDRWGELVRAIGFTVGS